MKPMFHLGLKVPELLTRLQVLTESSKEDEQGDGIHSL